MVFFDQIELQGAPTLGFRECKNPVNDLTGGDSSLWSYFELARMGHGLTISVTLLQQAGMKKATANRGFLDLVGRARFELATNGLKVRCSTG